MKKLLALLSLTAFLAVSVNAQTIKSGAPQTKKEVTVVKADVKAPAVQASSSKANAACCKNKDAKNCTAEQKAECAKACAKSGKEKSSLIKPAIEPVEAKAATPAKD